MLNQLKDEFISFLESKNRSAYTIISYRKDIEQLIDFIDGKGIRDIKDISLETLKEFLSAQKELGHKDKTISRKINSIKTFYKFLVNDGKVSTNTAQNLEHPKIETTPPNYLSRMEYMALRDISRRNLRNYTIIELMLQAGLRISEIANLKKEDIHLNAKKPYIKVEAYGSNPERKVLLNETAIDAIQNCLEKGDPEGEYLFSTKTGKPLLIRNIRTSITKLFEKAGIKSATVNDLRNTYIVHYLKEGMPLEKVAQQVGHKRTSTTQRYLDLIDPKEIKKGNRKYEDL